VLAGLRGHGAVDTPLVICILFDGLGIVQCELLGASSRTLVRLEAPSS